MSNILQILPTRPVDPVLQTVLQAVNDTAQALSLRFLVSGALARDLLLTHVYDQPIMRATRDVDLGVYIDNWQEFDQLKQALIDSHAFTVDAQNAHRLNHPNGIPLDLIPFGGVATQAQTITWPPNHDIILNVAGFADAFAACVVLQISPGLRINCCSLPSLAVLKLIAWKDRGLENNKDASDFFLIARSYGPNVNEDLLYDTEQALLAIANGDPELAGAQLLGKDARLQCTSPTTQAVCEIFQTPELLQRITDHLLRLYSNSLGEHAETHIEATLAAFERGFTGETF